MTAIVCHPIPEALWGEEQGNAGASRRDYRRDGRSTSQLRSPASGAWPEAPFFAALAHRPFALLWAGQTISRLGDSIHAIALAWCVLEETGSAALLPIGYATAGIAADRFAAAPVFVAGGAFSAAVIALGFLHPAIRGLD